jgi:hypothetical protein
VTKRLAGQVDNSTYPQISVTIDATLTTPANSAAPVPVIMELAFGGEYKASLARPISDTTSGALGDYGQTWERQVLARISHKHWFGGRFAWAASLFLRFLAFG